MFVWGITGVRYSLSYIYYELLLAIFQYILYTPLLYCTGSLYYIPVHIVYSITLLYRRPILYSSTYCILHYSTVQAAYTLVYAILVASSLCYLLITWSNQHMQSTIVTAFWPFQVSRDHLIYYHYRMAQMFDGTKF